MGREFVVSVMVVWCNAENGMEGIVRPGLCDEALSVQSRPNRLEV